MKWTRGPPIGRGSTATVSAAVVHPGGEILAVKSVELAKWKLLQSEQRLHSTIQCPYIIEYKGQDVTVEKGKPMYNIFMEFASSGSLAESSHTIFNDDATTSSFTRSILKGLEYLHSMGIVHCDIKPSNILVTEDGLVKIADLGCARLVGGVAGSDWRIAGTPAYMAPEVARGEQQGYPADVWALGCTVIEMATGHSPWRGGSDPVSVLYRIGFLGQVPEIPELLADEAKDFVAKCLNRDPEQRWSVKQLLRHPFVNPDLVSQLPPGSPTSVLNRDPCDPKWDQLWSSTSDEEEDPTRVLKSPAERIRMMVAPGSGMEGLSGLDPDDESCWMTVRSCSVKEEMRSGKACFSDRVELESSSFDVENFENSIVTCFADDSCSNIDTICSTTIPIVSTNSVNGVGEFSSINFLQFESTVHGFPFPSIKVGEPIYIGCFELFRSQLLTLCYCVVVVYSDLF